MFIGFFLAAITFIVGVICKKYRSNYPDVVIGYRTKRAIRSKEAWEFANEHAGKMALISSSILLGINLLFIILQVKGSTILVVLNFLVPFELIMSTERKLRNNY